jgi:copper(I)-binding protein
MNRKILRLLLLLGTSLFGATPLLGADGVQVKDAWVREGPPTAQVLAGFMKVHNGSDKSAALVGASSPAFGRIELHRTVMEDGVARMIAQDRIEIPAGADIAFEPGGLHLMLFDPTHPLTQGDELALAIELEDGRRIETQAQVRRMMGGSMEHHHHH